MKKIVLILIISTFIIILTGCPGNTKNLNQFNFYDGYYAYKTEVYIDEHYSRLTDYNLNSLADGYVLEFTESNYLYIKANIELNNLILFDYNCKLDESIIKNYYYIFPVSSTSQTVTQKLMIIDENNNIYLAYGIFDTSKKNQICYFIHLYEQINNGTEINEYIDSSNNLGYEYFINNLDNLNDEILSSIEKYESSIFYQNLKTPLNNTSRNKIYKVDNNIMFQTYIKDNVIQCELLLIKDKKIIKSEKNYKNFKFFIYSHLNTNIETPTKINYNFQHNTIKNNIFYNFDIQTELDYFHIRNYHIENNEDTKEKYIQSIDELNEIENIIESMIIVKYEAFSNAFGFFPEKDICIIENNKYIMEIKKIEYYDIYIIEFICHGQNESIRFELINNEIVLNRLFEFINKE